jgi:hypothetical protein
MLDYTRAKPELGALQNLPHGELILRFKTGVENYDPRVLSLTDAQLDTAFRPDAGVGRWPCRVLLGHLADAEMLWNHRARRAVGEERPVLALWDENAFVDSNMYGSPETGARFPVGAFVAVVHSQRLWMAGWLETLTETQWQRAAMHPERGAISVRRIIELTTWHLEHHAWYLNAKVARLATQS